MHNDLANSEQSLRHGYAQLGAVRLHYVERGAGDKLVVFLHGFPECWYSWRHQLAALGDDFHVVAPDLRGYNLSDKPPRREDYTLDKLMDDVTGLIRHLGHTRATVVGHDWGAAIAWSLALQHPEYVEKLVALQVPPLAAWRDNLTLRQALTSWYMLFFQLPLLPEWLLRRNNFALLTRMFRRTLVRQAAVNETDLAFYRTALSEPGALTGAINYYRANVRRMLLKPQQDNAEKSQVSCPTLFIYGAQDPAVLPSTVANLGRYVAGPYQERHIKRSGHWVHQEAKEEVNALLTAFLQQS